MKGGEKISNFFKSRGRVFTAAVTGLICFISAFNIIFFDIVSLDKKQIVPAGSELSVNSAIFGSATAAVVLPRAASGSMAVSAIDAVAGANSSYAGIITVAGIPVKSVWVEEAERVMVQPGGQSIGILLQTDGVSVVGFSPVITEEGGSAQPAVEAGLTVNDFITAINEQKINCNGDIARIIEEAGQQGKICTIDYLRNGIKHSAVVEPLFCQDSQSWRIGLYVRDNTAGIGTLSFYEPASGAYGALGHEVPDLQYGVTGENKGSIVRAAVNSVKSGTAGVPGEKMGVFLDEEWSGSITANNTFGIFGCLNSAPPPSYDDELIPLALAAQAQPGPAEIYTVLDGETVESFKIEILKCMEAYKLTGRGMVIQVTDEDLLERSGGIVQGMSGSPIVQNGVLVGAVTHVFVNDPTCGYGCFSEWMWEDSGYAQE